MSRALRCDICDGKIKKAWEHIGQNKPKKKWWQFWQRPVNDARAIFWREGFGYDWTTYDICPPCWEAVKSTILEMRTIGTCETCGTNLYGDQQGEERAGVDG